jgi:hypothetical protein
MGGSKAPSSEGEGEDENATVEEWGALTAGGRMCQLWRGELSGRDALRRTAAAARTPRTGQRAYDPHAAAAAATAPPGCPLWELVRVDALLPPPLRAALNRLYTSLIADARFKAGFAACLAHHYPLLAVQRSRGCIALGPEHPIAAAAPGQPEAAALARHAPPVFDLSVQFLNRAHVVCELLRERGFLASALGGLCAALGAAVPCASDVAACLAPLAPTEAAGRPGAYANGRCPPSSSSSSSSSSPSSSSRAARAAERANATRGEAGALRHLFTACDAEGNGQLSAGQVAQLGRALGLTGLCARRGELPMDAVLRGLAGPPPSDAAAAAAHAIAVQADDAAALQVRRLLAAD